MADDNEPDEVDQLLDELLPFSSSAGDATTVAGNPGQHVEDPSADDTSDHVGEVPTWTLRSAEVDAAQHLPPERQADAVASPAPAAVTPPSGQTAGTRTRRRSLVGALALLVTALIMAGVGLGFWLGARSANDEQVANEDRPARDSTTTTTTAAGEAEGEPLSPSVQPSVVPTSISDPVDPVTGGPYPDSLSGLRPEEVEAADYPRVIIEGGRFTLAGRYPSEEIAAANLAELVRLNGEDVVDADYRIDPTIPIYLDTPIIIADIVAFDFNSTEVRPEYTALVDVGLTALNLIPGSTLEIVAYADARGSEEVNLRISQERADNLAALLIDAGIDPSRITAVGRGEVEAMEDDDAETAAGRRRAELVFIRPTLP